MQVDFLLFRCYIMLGGFYFVRNRAKPFGLSNFGAFGTN